MIVNIERAELVFLNDILEDFKERDKRFHFLNFNTSALLNSLSDKVSSLLSSDI